MVRLLLGAARITGTAKKLHRPGISKCSMVVVCERRGKKS